jgi:hypothetical protein
MDVLSESFLNRILVKLDKIDEKVNDLCVRVGKQETQNQSFIEDQLRSNEFKFKVLATLVGLIGGSFTILNMLRFGNLI